MKNQVHKDKNKRKLSFESENKQFILKSIYRNTNISKTIRWNSGLKFTQLSTGDFTNSAVDRCIMTGRKKKINKSFKFSRISFLKMARKGSVAGLRKASW